MSMSKPLTFKELEEGQFFICFPTDGDDSGHGGYRGGAYIFRKIANQPNNTNAERLIDGIENKWSDNAEVYPVWF